MNKVQLTAAGVAAVMLLNGCAQTPTHPMVQVLPAPGKSIEAFDAEKTYCRDYAHREVAGQAENANDRAVGTALVGAALGAGLGAVAGGGRGAAVGAAAGGTAGTLVGASNSANTGGHSIQYQYDNAYAQCMTAKGNAVQGHTVTVVHPVYAAPPTVVYSPPPTVVYSVPPGAVAAPAAQGGYAPPAGAVAAPQGYSVPPGAVPAPVGGPQ